MPYDVSEAQYEQVLTSTDVKFTPNNKKPSIFPVKPIAIELSNYFAENATLWVELHVAPETNLGRGGYAVVKINNVLNNKGEDIYDKDNALETEFFQKKFNSLITQESNPISEIRNVTLKKGTQEADIKSINGNIKLYLPVKSKVINITPADINQKKDISANLQITVKDFASDKIVMEVSGKQKNLLLNNFYAYNAQNILLENLSWGVSSAGTKDIDEKQIITRTVKGNASLAQLIVAEKIVEKEYKFTLNK